MNKDKTSASQPPTIDVSDLLQRNWHEEVKAASPSPPPKVGEQSHITNVTQDSGSAGSGQASTSQPSSSSTSSGQTSGDATSQFGGTNDGGTG